MKEPGGILTGLAIEAAVEAGDIVIDPYREDQVVRESRRNPASYDLTLGDEVAVYADVVERPEWNDPRHGHDLFVNRRGLVDAKKKMKIRKYRMSRESGWLIKPGIGYLMHTRERVRTDKYVPVLDGKSSVGRLFVAVHITAGYGDPGFDGQYTLEVTALHPTIVYPGMRFCQIRFHTAVGEVLSYQRTGHYRKKLASGPVPSMTWKQFEEDSRAPSLVSGRRGARGR